MQFKRIPRDVMDKRAVDQGDIHFFELAALGVDVKSEVSCDAQLTEFIIPRTMCRDVREAVKHWSQWIDYWSVDWDNKAIRSITSADLPDPQGPSDRLVHDTRYEEPNDYRIVVKVIDILGNDTTKT